MPTPEQRGKTACRSAQELDSAEYMLARRFLDSLGYEARFAPDAQLVAAR
ncbi:MAG: hypothetical protein HY000_37780 [Planctomycetes bacterium]|nr:hypothetical protein [Planctomycetota bacterium]